MYTAISVYFANSKYDSEPFDIKYLFFYEMSRANDCFNCNVVLQV
jgi:hypothetical protein